MRIALVSQEYPPIAHGGIGSQTYLKAHGLASLKHDVHVISSSQNRKRLDYFDDKVEVTRIPHFDDRMLIHTDPVRWITYSVEVAKTLSDVHSHTPFDIVDFPEWGGEGYIFLLNQTEWNRIPTVIHLHGPLVMFAHTMNWPEINSEFYRIGTQMESTCLRLADAVLSSSQCSANWCARHYGVIREQIPILHMGVDTDLFHPLDLPKESQPTIIFVGKIELNKGVDLLVEAACELARDYPDLRLWMLGLGNAALADELMAKTLARGFPDLLKLPGYISREDLPSWMSRAHVFAAPSVYEGGPGLVYLEAMACGLPVIACEGSGAAEVVIPEENGFLVPPGDMNMLMKTLRDILDDPEKREIMGLRARKYVLKEADSKICLKGLEAFYRDVISGKTIHVGDKKRVPSKNTHTQRI